MKKGQTYRFRVIGVGSMYPIRISVDQHNLTIVASDGYDVKPMIVESFIINPGERFDFLLTTDQNIDNYWIRGESIEVCFVFFISKPYLDLLKTLWRRVICLLICGIHPLLHRCLTTDIKCARTVEDHVIPHNLKLGIK